MHAFPEQEKSKTVQMGSRRVVVNVAHWDTTPVCVKATGNLSQPGRSPVSNSIVFALFEQKYVAYRVENFVIRSYPRFASTTTTTTAMRQAVIPVPGANIGKTTEH